ncbi:hypothetical protein F4779DRAFT_608668 [Xylariaceae sp. FL0662B]|nr:hypothetical protein F4779DRAFT_608668 [Xylariaceae sp. FL0662B]
MASSSADSIPKTTNNLPSIEAPDAPTSSTGGLASIKEQDTDSESVASKASTKASTKVVDRVITFHIDSDTVIPVKTVSGEIKFEVSSCSVAAASPVWRHQLYGKDAESRPSQGEWILNLEGDARALETLLRIVHYEFNKVPLQPTLDELYEITLLTCKYKCTHLIYPWANNWAKSLSRYVNHEDCPANCHKVIWCAWTLGDVRLFRKMADSLILSSKTDAQGQLVNVSGKPLKEMVLPPGLFGKYNNVQLPNLCLLLTRSSDIIASTRVSTIAKILEAVDTPLSQLASADRDPNVSFCRLGTDTHECEAMMLGSVIPAMMAAGLFPVPKAAKYLGSILELKAKLEGIKTIPYRGPDYAPHRSHNNCNLRLPQRVDECLKVMPVPLKDDYMEHLSVQAETSGVENGTELDEYRRRTPKQDSPSSPIMKPESIGTESIKDDAGDEGTSLADDQFSDAQESTAGESEHGGSDVTMKNEKSPGSEKSAGED